MNFVVLDRKHTTHYSFFCSKEVFLGECRNIKTMSNGHIWSVEEI